MHSYLHTYINTGYVRKKMFNNRVKRSVIFFLTTWMKPVFLLFSVSIYTLHNDSLNNTT